jgi:hypothetical protein
MDVDLALDDNPELYAQGITFLDAVGPVKIRGRAFELRWLTTARDDIPTQVQLADLTKIQSLQAQVSIEDPDTTKSAIIRGRTIGLGKRRAMNFTARGRHLHSMIPQGAGLPDELWLDIILGAPFVDPDGPVEGHLVMPMDAQELRSLGFALRAQSGDAGKDAVHLKIAEIRARLSPIKLDVVKIHPLVRRHLEKFAPSALIELGSQPGM